MPVTFPIPPVFLKRMSRYLEEEYSEFERVMQGEPVSGLRVNTLKLSGDEFQKRSPVPLGEPVPWSSASFILPQSKAPVGSHPYHQAGLYYIQDPSAMAPASLLDPHPGERVLDLAAAPGGKTTHLAALMQGTGLLVANDIKDSRVGHLVVNMERGEREMWSSPTRPQSGWRIISVLFLIVC
jgi:16S rRNA C967 or C1407 C5-methylase (RsmB/RsmF family)